MTYFWQRNINEIENFSAASEWTADASSTLSDDTTNNVIGSNAVKLLESDNVASWGGMSRNITALDLTKYHDGSASTTADLRVDSYSTINAQNQYFTLQYLQMIRADPDFATYTNAFQEYFGTSTGWISKFSVYYDF